MKHVKNFFIITLTFLFLMGQSLQSFSQGTQVKIKVIGDDKMPVQDANIEVAGNSTLNGQTDSNGLFTLNVTGVLNLKISHISHLTKSIKIDNKSANVTVTLENANSTLQDVIVTGYTSQKKQDITGAVTVVKVSELNNQTNSSVASGLQGLAAGVTVSSSGAPGSQPTVLIRGIQSLSLNNSPLYVIDGVPTSSLSDINQNDILNIQVLKDAASAAQYGSRASNGVVLITTKRGTGGLKLSYDAYWGIQTAGKGIEFLNPQEDADLTWLAFKNSGVDPSSAQYGSGTTPIIPDVLFSSGGGGVSGISFSSPYANPALYNYPDYFIINANKTGTNWYNEILNNAPQQNHNISISTGGPNGKAYFGLNYFNQQGIVIHTNYERYQARINTEYIIKKVVRIGENVSLSYSRNTGINNQQEGNPINIANRQKTIIPVYDIGGNFAGTRGQDLGSTSNPVADLTWAKDNSNKNYRIIGNAYLEADILKSLTFRTSFGGEFNFGNYYRYQYQTFENAENTPSTSFVEGYYSNKQWTWTNTLAFKKIFKEKHNFLALIGTEAIETSGRNLEGSRVNYYVNDPAYRSINTGNPPNAVSGAPSQIGRLFSVFGKVSYNYDSRYYFDGNLRRDGSNVFSQANQFAVFPSFSVGWALNNEKFLNQVNWINQLKLRLGWGQVGNQYIPALNPYNTYLSSLANSSYDWNGTKNSVIPGFYNNQLGNPNGKWEVNTSTNIGVDASFFQNKLSISIDLYQNKITDLLYQAPLNNVTQGNVTAPYINIGAMTNKGLDVSITYRGETQSKFTYSITTNITSYRNEINYLSNNVSYFDAGAWRNGNFVRNQVGNPISSFYGYQVVGFFQNSADTAKYNQVDKGIGRYRYADVNGYDTNGNLTGAPDGKVDQADRTFIGNPNPQFTYGININLGYRNFDLTLFFYGVQGRDVINYEAWWRDFYATFVGAKSKDALYNSWSPSNPNARLPIVETSGNFSNSNVFNSSLVEDGSFFRLKNFILGYTIPSKQLKKAGIEKLRFYIQATNLFTITKYRGLDPEFQSQNGSTTAFGIDYGNYPVSKFYNVGLTLNF
ncbi:MAG: TonB-dependent receptor [Alphaproteobacteria bacterium]|nr:TonB-dependent receptor [Alphaproteobacteria bacterium]